MSKVCKSSYKTRSQLNLDNKREICEYAKRHPKAKHGEIANPLSFEQIVDLVNTENIEYTSDDSSEEVLPVQLKEARIGLETATKFFEQQSDDAGFDIKDLRVFQKI